MSCNKEYQALTEQVINAAKNRTPVKICGAGSKSFYGSYCDGEPLDVCFNSGIIEHEPSELFVTVRAGTNIEEVNKALDKAGQHLAFEPPLYQGKGSIGGMVAAGISGPARPYLGGIRDHLLGVKCMNGKGEILNFGGKVIKNVAGYDVSRLMCGALGTLGILLEVSLKVLPQPQKTKTLIKQIDLQQARHWMQQWQYRPLPITGLAYDSGSLYVRLSGSQSAVENAQEKIEFDEHPNLFWQQLRNHSLDFFQQKDLSLWCLHPLRGSLIEGIDESDCLIDWGGGQYWFMTDVSAEKIYDLAAKQQVNATLFRNDSKQRSVFSPLVGVNKRIHQRLKQSFDPEGIFNPGRIYPDW